MSLDDLVSKYGPSFYMPKRDLIQKGLVTALSVPLFYSTFDLFGTSFLFGGLVAGMEFLSGLSDKSQKEFFSKYVNFDSIKDLNFKNKFFSKKNLISSSVFLSLSAYGLLKGQDYSLDNLITSFQDIDFTSRFAFSTAVMARIGYVMQEPINSIISNYKSIPFAVSTLFNIESKDLLIKQANEGHVESIYDLSKRYFKEGDSDSALSLFFENFYLNNRSSDSFNPSSLYSAVYLEKYSSTKELLVYSLMCNFPKEFIDGVVDVLIDESIEDKDISALALCGFYLNRTNTDKSSHVWSNIGNLLIESESSLEQDFFTSGSSKINRLSLAGKNTSIISSTVLQKVFPPNHSKDDFDEVAINIKAQEYFKNDSSIKFPLILDSNYSSSSQFILSCYSNQPSLFSVVKNNPHDFDFILDNFHSSSKKVSDFYADLHASKEIHFKNIDNSSRIKNQSNTFKEYFNLNLALDSSDRLNQSVESIDIFVPSIDNIPEQWLYDFDKNVFHRLDLANKGLRPSIENYVNSSLWVYGSLPNELLDKSINFFVNAFSKDANVDYTSSSNHFLNALFERRNHLLNNWNSRPRARQNSIFLLDIVDRAITILGDSVSSKSYLNKQIDQNNSFYTYLTR